MTTTLINLLEQRLNNITNRWRDVYNYKIDYFLRNSYDELDHININEPISSNLYQRALYEKNLIQSIQYSLKKNNLILRRTANNRNTFYMGNIQDFETKADKYLTRSDDYKVLIDINDENNEKPLDGASKDPSQVNNEEMVIKMPHYL
ncbi:unnamed protein product [Rotaria sordida]|uniref:Uncharacterized protein n=1 Tax=Rotaria sordida TaxID=392033 RepID=A0A814SK76_9BILA|nr:unnamed protein product [Rotaria sordida]CAF1405675.1 unnamed protein product [Rotaria sordida]CAF3909925.1 unnamed protein product [Rotaria sordida]CAF4044780.1 unnamed protein product [Rotaria sordida]